MKGYRYFINSFNGCKYMSNVPKVISTFLWDEAYEEISKDKYEELLEV